MPEKQGVVLPSSAPQQSERSFISPSSVPIKKTPRIDDLLVDKPLPVKHDTLHSSEETVEKQNVESAKETVEKQNVESSVETVEKQNVESKIQNTELPQLWNMMLQSVFQSIPTIYYPLKDIVPQVKDNVIYLVVKNAIQKEHFENKRREVFEYLNQHASFKVEDIIITVDELVETKKIIYDQDDKIKNFTEQNPEFQDFLQILDLKIKD